MCGIVGVVYLHGNGTVDPDLLDRMTDVLSHRGPDDRGTHCTGPAGLGVRRLSIIDIAGGHQPIFSEDGSRAIVYNGEVYNHAALRADLEARGHRFRTRCDTEVVLHLYEEKGLDCAQDLDGEFAYAIWDERTHTLCLTRDRLGVRPLYYTVQDGRFLFASEVKALLQDPAVPRRIDLPALEDLLTLGFVIAPRTLFADIWQVPAGHTVLVSGGTVRLQRYWDIPYDREAGRAPRKREADYADELRSVLATAAQSRLMSDVPVGVFLSGGVDSSAIVALAAPASPTPLTTFVSRQLEGPEFDEAPFARLVADQYHTDHHELVFAGQSVPEAVTKLIWHLDEPRAGAAAMPQMAIAEMASQLVKVGLGGQGSDETFGGYARFGLCNWPRALFGALTAMRGPQPAGANHHTSQVRPNILKQVDRRGLGSLLRHATSFLGPSLRRHYLHLEIATPSLLRALLQTEVHEALAESSTYDRYCAVLDHCDARHPLNRLLYLETKTYLQALLMVDDRTSMAASLETRPPLIDHHVVEYAAEIPPDLKVKGLTAKYILKRALARDLPETILNRRKMGFPTPIEHWLRGDLREWMLDLLLSERTRQRGLFHQDALKGLVERRERIDPRVWDRAVWILIGIEEWARQFLDGDGLRHRPPRVAQLRRV